ncbi:MAG: MBL fold metallo-hydrolase [Bacteroidia bacterium]
MRIEYISHSCFVINTGRTVLAFDPWITGSTYQNQWYLYPQPHDIAPVVNADVILISHGHEDHFNNKSLRKINKDAHIFFPFQWRAGIVSYLKHLKFQHITEALSFKTYQHKDVKITYLGYSMESVIVVECDNYVVVNINDALNSNHETAVDFLLKEIKSRWKKIDFLLSGWSGAGYFPNKVHYPGKNDEEVARIREQFFADNFCKFTKYLQPEIAIPFAPGFVLLSDENRWINNIKFPRGIIEQYYRDNFDKETHIQFPVTYPGDYFIHKTFHPISDYHKSDDETIYKQVDEVFSDEIKQANSIEWMEENKIPTLIKELELCMNNNKRLYHPNVIQDVFFSIRFKDIAEENYFHIFPDGNELKVKRTDKPTSADRLIITIKASLLAINLEKPWGGDLLSIGYGVDVEVFEELTLEKNLDIVCVRLISRFPIFKDDMLQHSGRILKYYLTNPALTNLWIKQKITLRPYVNKYPFNERDHWITYNKCDLCKVCKIPEFDFKKLKNVI